MKRCLSIPVHPLSLANGVVFLLGLCESALRCSCGNEPQSRVRRHGRKGIWTHDMAHTAADLLIDGHAN